MHTASLLSIKHIQSSCFTDEISKMKKRHKFPKSFLKLFPFIDTEGVLKVGGRKRNAPSTYDKNFPALPPSRSQLTDMIIDHFYRLHFHAGIQNVQYLIAHQYWIIFFECSIRRVLSKCVNCFKLNLRTFRPVLMWDLSPAWISCVKPFLHTGVDCASPFKVCISRHRGIKYSKPYIYLFIRFAT